MKRVGGSETNYSPKGRGGMKAPSKSPTPADNIQDGKQRGSETDNSPTGWGGMTAPCQSPTPSKKKQDNLSAKEQLGYKSLIKRCQVLNHMSSIQGNMYVLPSTRCQGN